MLAKCGVSRCEAEGKRGGPANLPEGWLAVHVFDSANWAVIRWWLNEHKSVKRYAILDDHDVCVRDRELEPHFVQTDSNVGVTQSNLDRMASILRSQSAVIS